MAQRHRMSRVCGILASRRILGLEVQEGQAPSATSEQRPYGGRGWNWGAVWFYEYLWKLINKYKNKGW